MEKTFYRLVTGVGLLKHLGYLRRIEPQTFRFPRSNALLLSYNEQAFHVVNMWHAFHILLGSLIWKFSCVKKEH